MDVSIEDLLAAPIKEKYNSKLKQKELPPTPPVQELSHSSKENSPHKEQQSSSEVRSGSRYEERYRSDRRHSHRSPSPRRYSPERYERREDRERRDYRVSPDRYDRGRRDYRGSYDERRVDERRDSYERKRSSFNRYSRSPPGSFQRPITQREQTPPFDPAKRDIRTVFCTQLAARLTNRELFDFLKPCGRIREAKLVMDKITRRSKGVGYVEFYHEDSVPKAIAMTGQKLLGIPIIIHTSDAERNRVGESAVSTILCAPPPPEPTHKIFVGCLHQKVTENDLKKLFERFGEIEEVKLHIDSTTGRSKGFGFIEFRNTYDAGQAIKRMNDYEIYGKKVFSINEIHVGPVSETQLAPRGEYRGIDDTQALTLTNIQARVELMAKLARDEVKSTNVRREPRPPSESIYVLFKNMFDPTEETEKNWDKDLADDVRLECETYGIVKDLKVDKHTKCGQIYVKCQDTRHARKILDAINGRYFDGRKVEGVLMREAEYKSAVSKLR